MKHSFILSTEAPEQRNLRNFKVLDTGKDPGLDDIVEMAAKVFDVPMAMVSLLDENRQWFKATRRSESTSNLSDLPFSVFVLTQDDVFVVNDTLEDERFFDNRFVTGKPNIRFYAGACLFSKQGQHLGTLSVMDSKPRGCTAEERSMLQKLGRIIVSLIELHLKDEELTELSELNQREREELNRCNQVKKQMIRVVEMEADRLHDLYYHFKLQNGNDNIIPSLVDSSDVLRNMAAWARTELEDKDVSESKVSATQLLKDLVREMDHEFKRKGNNLVFDPIQAHFLDTNEAILKFVLKYLLARANFHTDQGNIVIQAIEDKDHLLIMVCDEGPKMVELKKMDMIKWEQSDYTVDSGNPDHLNFFFCWQVIRKLGGWMELKTGQSGSFVSITLKKKKH